MKRIDMFICKYGPVDGPKIYSALQANAANARWKAFYRDR
jgi:hypothetical protein